ncbi:MAG: tetratricopeptide repeat protein [Polyangiaceae bacterium]
MNKRLAYLEQILADGKADSFARYALGMEYRKEGRLDDALRVFDELRAADPNYLAMYLMVGQIAAERSDPATAKEWLTAGREVAQSQGNSQALGEIEDLLAGL